MKSKEVISTKLIQDAKQIIENARKNAVRSVDFCRVQMYWNLGRRIFEEEQHGKKRADYGAYIVKSLAEKLEAEYGSGFSKRQLEFCRQFYNIFPIANALRSQLNWSQYRMLIQISDPDKREYYELEAVNNSWNGRELERQINSQLYERLLLSNDKESVLAVARKERIPETPQEVIKDPMILEFVGLKMNSAFMKPIWKVRLFRILLIFCSNWVRVFPLLPGRSGLCSKTMNSSSTLFFTTGCFAALWLLKSRRAKSRIKISVSSRCM